MDFQPNIRIYNIIQQVQLTNVQVYYTLRLSDFRPTTLKEKRSTILSEYIIIIPRKLGATSFHSLCYHKFKPDCFRSNQRVTNSRERPDLIHKTNLFYPTSFPHCLPLLSPSNETELFRHHVVQIETKRLMQKPLGVIGNSRPQRNRRKLFGLTFPFKRFNLTLCVKCEYGKDYSLTIDVSIRRFHFQHHHNYIGELKVFVTGQCFTNLGLATKKKKEKKTDRNQNLENIL